MIKCEPEVVKPRGDDEKKSGIGRVDSTKSGNGRVDSLRSQGIVSPKKDSGPIPMAPKTRLVNESRRYERR